MSDHISITGVCERDVDLLLLEEFVSSEAFLKWFGAQVGLPETDNFRLVRAERGRTESNGESDLEVTLEDAAKNRRTLLIENKIGASFQPQQAERYRSRGETYVRRKDCAACVTVLVAPEDYLGPDRLQRGFDAVVTYEAIRDWLVSHESLATRRVYKTALLGRAIDKAKHGYVAKEDRPVTDFWTAYWRMAQESAPELQMREPSRKPSTSSFIYFRPTNLPPGVKLFHKLRHGNVDLQFASYGPRLADFTAQFKHLLEADMKIAEAAKSAVIRLSVPGMNTGADFADQATIARQGLSAAQRLLDWYRRVR